MMILRSLSLKMILKERERDRLILSQYFIRRILTFKNSEYGNNVLTYGFSSFHGLIFYVDQLLGNNYVQ